MKKQSNIVNAPQEIVGILEKRAILEAIHKWKLIATEERLEWIALCDRLIGTWLMLAHEAGSSLDVQELAIKADYNRLRKWMSDKTGALNQDRNK